MVLSEKQIQEVIEHVCRVNRAATVVRKINVQWSRRLKNKASETHVADSAVVLSETVFKSLTLAQQREAVSRETCHLIAWHKEQNLRSHNLWLALMARAGYPGASRNMEIPNASNRVG